MAETETGRSLSTATRASLTASESASSPSTAQVVPVIVSESTDRMEDTQASKTVREGVNPQEASSPRDGKGSSVETTVTEEASKPTAALHLNGENASGELKGPSSKDIRGDAGVAESDKEATSKGKRKKRKRVGRARLADVEEDAIARPVRSRLPPHQYETTLRRRAVRKREAASGPKSPSSVSPSESPNSSASRRSFFGHSPVETTRKQIEEKFSDENEEEPHEQYGDVSLGMKLTIVGGRVIVQGLNALSDGRASPAQLTGVIKRGDVLLSVDNVSLVNMPLNQLVEGLKPLSTPLNGDSYQRTLHLRFAVREGLSLLNKSEAQLASKVTAGDGASDMFSLSQFIPRDVPMVDQLSGLPMFPQKYEDTTTKPAVEPVLATPISESTEENEIIVRSDSISVDQQISFGVADQLDWERKKYMSKYFISGNEFSELLRPSSAGSLHAESGNHEIIMTQAEMLEQGGRAMAGAKVLCYAMEDLDKGKDTRSFSRWNSQISLRSRASSRRRYLLETASIAESNEDSSSSVGSAGSSGSVDLDEDGDEMLLGLAAYDEIWRRQVLETLQQAAEELEEEHGKSDDDDGSPQTHDVAMPSLDTALSMELGSLLFGEQMSRIMTKKKRPFALPPEEVTSVLFDLTTNIAAIMPDEISLRGKVNDCLQTNLTPFVKAKHSNVDENVALASRFIVEEALPAWLKSFRPLPWEQRRVLWPHTKSLTGDSHTISISTQAYSEDILTLDSDSTGFPSASRPSKNLKEKIEEMELNAETRAETCYLVTLFFTEVLLPKLESEIGRNTENSDRNSAIQEIIHFVETYGAYLKLHTCLVCAAVVEADEVISSLLKMAKHDVYHQKAMKDISKTKVFLLYEPAMLSAILKRLRGLKRGYKVEHQRSLLALCVSSFPDVRPWQVRKACLVDSEDEETAGEESGKDDDQVFADLYYEYLCLLLHPSEGHDIARRDGSLVNEWCEMSVQPSLTGVDEQVAEKRLQNFYTVASTASSDHRLYTRDLMLLLNLTMSLEEIDLALDLAGEIIDDPKHSTDKQVLSHVLLHLRTIAKVSVKAGTPKKSQKIDVPRLRRVLRLYHIMASKSKASRESIVVADELYALLLCCRSPDDISESEPTDKEIELIGIFVNNTAPTHFLQMLVLWTRSPKTSSQVIAFVHKTLLRGAQSGIHEELSGSLLRIKDARQHTTLGGQAVVVSTEGTTEKPISHRGNIWGRMRAGEAIIEK